MGGQHRPYTCQFREQAVKLVIDGQQPSRTARELGMPHSTLMIWLKRAGWRKPEPHGAVISEDPAVLQAQVRELQRRLDRSEMEKEILKKATAYFASLNLPASPSSGNGEERSR
jgi:transposase